MNLLRVYPRKLRERYTKNMTGAGIKSPEKYYSAIVIGSLIFSAVLTTVFYFLGFNPLLFFIASFIFLQFFFYFRTSLTASSRLKKIETMFPDVIQLMASNLRAGMTVDKAFLLAARPEFHPLDEEIMKAGREITTGKDIAYALVNMSERIGSEKISKTTMLILSGLKAGGNMSTLLEQTASNMREKEFMEKRAASSVLMYVIFIFFAVGVGGPVLFGLSSVLVEIIINLVRNMPTVNSSMNLPFTFRDIGLSADFVKYFALIFLLTTDLISSAVIGLVNKGEEKEGLKFFLPLAAASVGIFFAIRIVLLKFLAGTFSAVG
jgi:hypothetical protein